MYFVNLSDMEKNSKIYIAGHRGMVGSALMRKWQAEGFTNIITRTSAELDLRNQAAVTEFFCRRKAGICHISRG